MEDYEAVMQEKEKIALEKQKAEEKYAEVTAKAQEEKV